MNEKKEKDTLYDRLIKSLKNNPIIVLIMMIFLIYISVTKLIDSTAKNVENIPKIIGTETEKEIGQERNESEQENKKTATPSQESKHEQSNEKDIIPVEKFSFLLVLNSDQINSKIIIDGKPAKIISGHNTTYPEVEINKLDKEYSIQLTNDKYNCQTSQYLSSNHQKVYPCD